MRGNAPGFTLIELLASLSIFAVLAALLFVMIRPSLIAADRTCVRCYAHQSALRFYMAEWED